MRLKKKKWLKIKKYDPNKKILPVIRNNILLNSKSDDFEEARREWVPGEILDSDCENFTGTCMLCNQPNLETNFEIINENTGAKLHVGSTCITGFIIFQGTSSQEESNDFFTRTINKRLGFMELKALLPSVLTFRPEYTDVINFIDATKNVLGTLSQEDISSNLWQEYLKALFGENPTSSNINRIKVLLWDRKKVMINKQSKVLTDNSYKEGSWAGTIKTKKSKVETTLRKSKFDNPNFSS